MEFDSLQIGDIGIVSASIQTPFHSALADGRNSRCTAYTRSQLSVLEDASLYEAKERPCVVFKNRPYTSVCLMGTINGLDSLDHMPKLYRRFVVPVKRAGDINYSVNAQTDGAIRTTPPWRGDKPQWLVAWPFQPKNQQINNKWGHSSSTTYILDVPEMRKLGVLVRERQKNWERVVKQQRGIEEKQLHEHIKALRKANREKIGHTGNSQSDTRADQRVGSSVSNHARSALSNAQIIPQKSLSTSSTVKTEKTGTEQRRSEDRRVLKPIIGQNKADSTRSSVRFAPAADAPRSCSVFHGQTGGKRSTNFFAPLMGKVFA